MKTLTFIFPSTEENLSSSTVNPLKPKRDGSTTCRCHRDGAAGPCMCDAVSVADPVDSATR